MIRKLQTTEIDRAAEIWLDTNTRAHAFIPPQYWLDNYAAVRGQLAQAEVYVCETGGGIHGFIGLIDDYIAGLFVQHDAQSKGLGKELLNFAKRRRDELLLNVYRKNVRAIRFYQREGFRIQREGVDEDTGEKDYLMVWTRRRHPACRPPQSLSTNADMPQTAEAVNCEEAAP